MGKVGERPRLIQYQEYGDPVAREALVRRFLPLARKLARRFVHTGEPLDDLRQVAALGLIKAIDRFDPVRGTKFATQMHVSRLLRRALANLRAAATSG